MDIPKIAALFAWGVESIGHLFIDKGQWTKFAKIVLATAATLTGGAVIALVIKKISDPVKTTKVIQEHREVINDLEEQKDEDFVKKVTTSHLKHAGEVAVFKEPYLETIDGKPIAHFQTAQGSIEIMLIEKGDTFMESRFSIRSQKNYNQLIKKSGRELFDDNYLKEIGLNSNEFTEVNKLKEWFAERKLHYPEILKKPHIDKTQNESIAYFDTLKNPIKITSEFTSDSFDDNVFSISTPQLIGKKTGKELMEEGFLKEFGFIEQGEELKQLQTWFQEGVFGSLSESKAPYIEQKTEESIVHFDNARHSVKIQFAAKEDESFENSVFFVETSKYPDDAIVLSGKDLLNQQNLSEIGFLGDEFTKIDFLKKAFESDNLKNTEKPFIKKTDTGPIACFRTENGIMQIKLEEINYKNKNRAFSSSIFSISQENQENPRIMSGYVLEKLSKNLGLNLETDLPYLKANFLFKELDGPQTLNIKEKSSPPL